MIPNRCIGFCVSSFFKCVCLSIRECLFFHNFKVFHLTCSMWINKTLRGFWGWEGMVARPSWAAGRARPGPLCSWLLFLLERGASLAPLPKILSIISCALDSHAVYAHLYERTSSRHRKKQRRFHLLDGHSQSQILIFFFSGPSNFFKYQFKAGTLGYHSTLKFCQSVIQL